MVYYRKYRPQTIEELDSTKVRETLTAVLSKSLNTEQEPRLSSKRTRQTEFDSVPHAFLFTGPKGLGKTSTARIIAKVVNCTAAKKDKKNGFEPCGTCDSCVSITNGSNIDVLEIDGASNRGIDEIRDLREKVKLAPSNAKKKVYIIDEVHMLTTEAFNALLKTIEEPPSHVMFMFATTEPQKVPATILSRCFHVAFPRATDEDIVHSLERIVKGEKLEVDKEALLEIAKMADGGFRDSAKMLEELVAVAGEKKIDKVLVESQLHVSSILYFVSSILGSLYEKKTKESLEIINQVVTSGTEVKYFVAQILDCLHELLLVQEDLLPNTKYQIQNTKYSLDDIKRLTELFSKAYQDTKYAVVPQLPLELAVIEWCENNSKFKNQNAKLEQSADTEEVVVATPEVTVAVSKKSGLTIDEARKKEQTLKVRSILDGKKEEKKPQGVAGVTQNPIPHNVSERTQLMENIIYKVKSFNHSLAGVLRGCDIAAFDDTKLTLATAYKFHKERLDDAKAKEALEQAIKEITGKQIQILVQLKNS